MKKIIVTGALALFVSGCAEPQLDPVVVSFNEASVGVQITDGHIYDVKPKAEQAAIDAAADAEAAEICRRGPKRQAEFTSVRRIRTGDYTHAYERLYLCLS